MTTTEKITVTCPECSARMRAPASAAGKRCRCPKCGGAVLIAPPDSAPAESFKTRCPHCESKLRLPARAAGRRVKCPGCQQAFAATPAAAPVAPATAAGGADDLFDGLGSEGDPFAGLDSGQAAPAPPPAALSVTPCPKCSHPLHAGAIICTACGLDTRKGRSVLHESAVQGAARAAGGFASAAAALGGRFVLGTVLSAMGAAFGGAIWFVISLFGVEVGWIAWIIGLLAGGGMMLGNRNPGVIPGATAAALAVSAILGARFATFALIGAVLSVVEAGALESRDSQLDFLASVHADRQLEQRVAAGEFGEDDDAYYEAMDALFEERYEEMDGWSDERVRSEAEAEIAAFEAEVDDVTGGRRLWSWSVFDVIFFGLAILTAFKLGSGLTGG